MRGGLDLSDISGELYQSMLVDKLTNAFLRAFESLQLAHLGHHAAFFFHTHPSLNS